MPPVPMAARRVPAITGMPPVDPHASMCVGAALYRACACRCNPIVSFSASLQQSEPARMGSRLQMRLLDARLGRHDGASPKGMRGGYESYLCHLLVSAARLGPGVGRRAGLGARPCPRNVRAETDQLSEHERGELRSHAVMSVVRHPSHRLDCFGLTIVRQFYLRDHYPAKRSTEEFRGSRSF